MNSISIDTQKKIMFLPLVNFAILFVFYINALQVKLPSMKILKGGVIAIIWLLPVMTVQFLISLIVPSVAEISGLCAAYLGAMSMGFGLVQYQEKLNIFI